MATLMTPCSDKNTGYIEKTAGHPATTAVYGIAREDGTHSSYGWQWYTDEFGVRTRRFVAIVKAKRTY